MAVGTLEQFEEGLGAKVLVRTAITDGDQHQLRDAQQLYMAHFGLEKEGLGEDISLRWDVYPDI